MRRSARCKITLIVTILFLAILLSLIQLQVSAATAVTNSPHPAVDANKPDLAASKLQAITDEQDREFTKKYRVPAPAFVRAHYPNDPEMLMAAGLFAMDDKTGLDLLRQAAEKGNAPVYWAAYVARLARSLPEYRRLGNTGADPNDSKETIQKYMRDRPGPDRLTPAQAVPILQALTAWQQADPKNGAPVAVQMWYAYGLHNDNECLHLWQEASRKPLAKIYEAVVTRDIALLLSRIGDSKVMAVIDADTATGGPGRLSTMLRDGARIASYEGRRAQIAGRNKEAILWWNSTMAFGEHMRQSADTDLTLLVGVAVHAIGASPSWKWYRTGRRTTATGLVTVDSATRGPLSGGRVYFGKQHDFYVSQVGAQADAQVRDTLVKNCVRKNALSEQVEKLNISGFSSVIRWITLLAAGGFSFMLLLLISAIAMENRRIARKRAEQAADLHFAIAAAIVIVAFLPTISSAILTWQDTLFGEASGNGFIILLFSELATFLLLLIAALFIGRYRLPRSVHLIAAWRAGQRKLFPLALVLSLCLTATFAIAGFYLRAQWLNNLYSPNYSELQPAIKAIGAQWENPIIPKDAWRAEYPREVKNVKR
jgi:hypothetical protein